MSEFRPPSSEKERPVSNREVPGSSPGEGSSAHTQPEQHPATAPTHLAGAPVAGPLWHYVVVRRELAGGALLAQVVHAAGESAAAFAMNTGRHLPNDVRAVVLVATKDQMQAIIDEHQYRSDTQFFPIVETDGPLAGSTTAIGFTPTTKEHLTPILGHLRPWRAA